jgi:hypothetical protein
MITIETKSKDKTTGLEIVLACCDYNQASKFLARENADRKFGQFLGATGTKQKAVIVFEKARFVYEAERGVLLRGE